MIAIVKCIFRIAYNTLYAAQGAKHDKAKFLSVLRESVYWQIDGRKYEDEIEKIKDGIMNEYHDG